MMIKNNPRTCIITKRKLVKNELIRFVIKDQKLIFDQHQNHPGRGYYIINDVELLRSEKTRHILMHRFKPINIDEFISSLN